MRETRLSQRSTAALPAPQEVFDFDALRKFVARKDFTFCFDALHAVTGAYAGPLFCKELGAPESYLR